MKLTLTVDLSVDVETMLTREATAQQLPVEDLAARLATKTLEGAAERDRQARLLAESQVVKAALVKLESDPERDSKLAAIGVAMDDGQIVTLTAAPPAGELGG